MSTQLLQTDLSVELDARPTLVRTDIVEIELAETDLDVLVSGKRLAADGVMEVTLRPAAGGALPSWTPGAHVDLLLDPVAPGARVRQYSLCGDPADTTAWRIAVLREADGSGTSAFVHDQLQAGDRVRVRGPRNHFPLEPAASYLFIAGGVGITPLLPMLAAAERAGAPWNLVYCGRSRASMAYADDLSAAHGDRVRIHGREESGPLDLIGLLAQPRAGALVYCCGPERLIAAAEAACSAWPVGSLHVERFAARPVEEPVRADTFEVVLVESGLTVQVPPERSILSVVEEAGINVLTSCEEGTCGTCETAVLDGVPDHRDSVLSATERAAGDCMMICVSRSCTPRLVLEL